MRPHPFSTLLAVTVNRLQSFMSSSHYFTLTTTLLCTQLFASDTQEHDNTRLQSHTLWLDFNIFKYKYVSMENKCLWFNRIWINSERPSPGDPPPPRDWASLLSSPISRMFQGSLSCFCPGPRARSCECRRRCRWEAWSPSADSGSWTGLTSWSENKDVN